MGTVKSLCATLGYPASLPLVIGGEGLAPGYTGGAPIAVVVSVRCDEWEATADVVVMAGNTFPSSVKPGGGCRGAADTDISGRIGAVVVGCGSAVLLLLLLLLL